MRQRPKSARPMSDAPKDGAIIDLWSDTCGWVSDVWFYADFEQPDGWVTICPRPFSGWRRSRCNSIGCTEAAKIEAAG